MKKIIKKFYKDYDEITKYYNYLMSRVKDKNILVDNYYLLLEHKKNISNQKRYLSRNYKTIEDNYLFLKKIVIQKNYNINFKYLVDELKKYQKETNKIFTYKELSTVFQTLLFIYIEKLNEIEKENKQNNINEEKIQSIYTSSSSLTDFLPVDFNISKNPNYICEINRICNDNTSLFKELYKYLENKKISLKELINDELERNINKDILLLNIFNNLKDFFNYQILDLFEKVSLTEKLLQTDKSYKKMTLEEKEIYRNRIVLLSKKERLNEYKYLEKNYVNNDKLDLKEFIEKNKELKVPEREKIQIIPNIEIELEEETIKEKETSKGITVLSNKKYSLVIDDKGNSFSRFNTIQLNRYRNIDKDYGIYLFIKDISNNNIWSNTYSPMNKNPDKYEVSFSNDKVEYLREDDKVSTKTEIIVCENYNAEIRKITFTNNSKKDKVLELTSYTEPIISENIDDITNKINNSLLVKTEYDKTTNSLIAKRKNLMVTRLIIDSPQDKYSYETERSSFIGRENTLSTSIKLNEELSNYAGDNLDPVLSLRNKVLVKPNESTTVYLLVGQGRTKDQIKEVLKYYNKENLEKEFEISRLSNIYNNKNLNISDDKIKTYNSILNYIYNEPKLPLTEERMDYLRRNALSKTGLLKFGVSGNNPIITVEINDNNDISFIKEIIKAFEYYKNKSIFIDIIIINDEKTGHKDIIKKQVSEELYRIYKLNSFYNTPGTVTIVDAANLTREDRNLLNVVPSIKFIIENHISLKEVVNSLEDTTIDYPIYEKENNIETKIKDKLVFNNNYGGFKNEGSEYVVYNKNTPTPWSNVIANKNFGTVITNNGCGYTYAYNSNEFKISSWTNELVINDKSEGFKFNNELFEPEKCTHGFGYSILESETKKLSHSVTEFVAKDDNVKIYLLKLTNKENKNTSINVEYFIKPVCGDYEENTNRYILSEFISEDNYLKLRNTYSNNYSDVNVFISSSEKINTTESNSINTDIKLKAKEEKEIVFVLGCSISEDEIEDLINKYKKINNCKKELIEVQEEWKNKLSTINVKTPDESFNYMINGWYLYQTISSRIRAKAGFYEVGGYYSYRDLLQDAINICLIKPLDTRKQILINAAHQFTDGDVLHWWNEKNHFGLRSRYKDDYLWLVYATLRYLEITEDFDILNESIPYIQGEKLSDYETEKEIIFNYSNKYESLLKHLIKSIDLSMKSLGSHKIPLMGEGDINDAMNKVGIKGKGESVSLGFFLYGIINKFINMMNKYDKEFDLTKYTEFNEKLKDNLNNKTWDGSYYLRAFFDNGDTLGSHENTECKIDLLPQSFSILSEVVPKDRIDKILESIDKQLVEDNLIKQISPAFSKSLNNPGTIMDYPKGIKENGGQVNQTTSWYIMSLIKEGYYDKAYDYYKMTNPINRNIDEYKVEPYVTSNSIYSNEEFSSRGGYTWYTPSSGWLYRIGIEEILGIKKQGNKLVIKPSIPKTWNNYKAVYKYKDTIYNIEVIRNKKERLLLDDKEINSVSLKNDKETHKIIVNIK